MTNVELTEQAQKIVREAVNEAIPTLTLRDPVSTLWEQRTNWLEGNMCPVNGTLIHTCLSEQIKREESIDTYLRDLCSLLASLRISTIRLVCDGMLEAIRQNHYASPSEPYSKMEAHKVGMLEGSYTIPTNAGLPMDMDVTRVFGVFAYVSDDKVIVGDTFLPVVWRDYQALAHKSLKRA